MHFRTIADTIVPHKNTINRLPATSAHRPRRGKRPRFRSVKIRLAAQTKLGYYPAPLTAISALATHLSLSGRIPDRYSRFTAIDPCAGEGEAIAHLAAALGIADCDVYTIELDPDRADAIRARSAEFNVLGPASAMGSKITAQSFGLAYVNPPFDDELGGGSRVEQTFLSHATRLLITGGILVFVLPYHVINTNTPFVDAIDAGYEDLGIYKFPEFDRHYGEAIIIARKRREMLAQQFLVHSGDLHRLHFPYSRIPIDAIPDVGTIRPHHYDFGDTYTYSPAVPIGVEPALKTWKIPPSWPPTTFSKIRLTDGEIAHEFASSPLNAIFDELPPIVTRRPPLPLNNGHLGMLLAAGMLDGTVDGPDASHVVRGSSRKDEYLAGTKVTENEKTGAIRTQKTISETIVTTIRIVTSDGKITTYSNGEAPATSDEDPGETSDDE